MDYPSDQLPDVLRPITSLLSKSEKALQKLSPHTWQHAMLINNVAALRLSLTLMQGDQRDITPSQAKELQTSVDAFASMIEKTETALKKFSPGTAQHSLLRNRLHALRVAEDVLKKHLPPPVETKR